MLSNLFAPALAIALGLIAMIQPARADDKPLRSISVSATGSVTAAPDEAHIATGVVSEGKTAREALDANTKAMKQLIDGIKALGIDAKDIQTSQLSVQPRYQSAKEGRPPAIAGYQVTNQVEIAVRDIKRLGEILDKAVTLGANQMHGIRFGVSKAETLRDEARRRAVANAMRRAKLYAEAAGASVGRVLAISEGDVAAGPRPMPYTRTAMASAVPVEPGEQTLTAEVQVTWALE